ncbi:MAG TPA: class I SAM-dependent methyltransferase [Candidatus Woesebacteria bacterium]|nr:class I SAM-dependent methyltransferase [Candidatus Woesebacteria bacterium]
MEEIANPQIYLERMSKPLQEKLRVAKFITEGAKSVLDVGCANGVVTIALAKMFPEVKFVGIDLNKDFIEIAKKEAEGVENISFEHVYLRERLANQERFDVVLFCSVLHEFFTYGEGISTIVKAMADAHEILNPGGRLIIRDMVLFDYMTKADLWLPKMIAKVKNRSEIIPLISDFEKYFGEIKSIKQLNHFLLKYKYTDNWERECRENYTPVSFEQYDRIFGLLGMKDQYRVSYTISYLNDLWREDFDLTEEELSCLRSTGIVVAEKENLQ